jgi:hypothetical protein
MLKLSKYFLRTLVFIYFFRNLRLNLGNLIIQLGKLILQTFYNKDIL